MTKSSSSEPRLLPHARQDGLPVGGQVHRLGDDGHLRQQPAVVVTHRPRPEGEVEDDVPSLDDSATSRSRRPASMSARTSAGSGTVVMPRRHISPSKESRTRPSASSRRAYVDFPDPAGPHISTTRLLRSPAPLQAHEGVAVDGQRRTLEVVQRRAPGAVVGVRERRDQHRLDGPARRDDQGRPAVGDRGQDPSPVSQVLLGDGGEATAAPHQLGVPGRTARPTTTGRGGHLAVDVAGRPATCSSTAHPMARRSRGVAAGRPRRRRRSAAASHRSAARDGRPRETGARRPPGGACESTSAGGPRACAQGEPGWRDG